MHKVPANVPAVEPDMYVVKEPIPELQAREGDYLVRHGEYVTVMREYPADAVSVADLLPRLRRPNPRKAS
jgi:hypothetical protein